MKRFTYFYVMSFYVLFNAHAHAMEQLKKIEETHKNEVQQSLLSLQGSSSIAVVEHLVSFVEQETNSNNNTLNQQIISDLPAFLSTYVPEMVTTFEPILNGLFTGLLESEKISAGDKILLLNNHMQKTRASSWNNGPLGTAVDVGFSARKPIMTKKLFDTLDITNNTDVIVGLSHGFQKIGQVTVEALQEYIIEHLGLTGQEQWKNTMVLRVLKEVLAQGVQFSNEQKYLLLVSSLKNAQNVGIEKSRIADLIDDSFLFIFKYITGQIKVRNDSPAAITRTVDNIIHELGKAAGYNDFAIKTLRAEMYAALMLSDAFTIAEKKNIWFEVLAFFGRHDAIGQTKYIMQVIETYFKDPAEYVGVNTPVPTPEGITTLLHLAIIKVRLNPKFAQLIINLGANVNAKDWQGRTPLYNALALESRDALNMLLKAGARVDIVDNNNQTPLHVFFANLQHVALRPDVIESMLLKLIAHGALLNVADKNGDTPLALWRKVTGFTPEEKDKIEQILIKKGAQ